MDRITFINRFIRFSLLGGLVLLTGFLVARRNVKALDSCSINPYCSKCSDLAVCSKPEAIKQRNNGGK